MNFLNQVGAGLHMDPIRLLNKFCSCYMAIVVVIVNRRGLGINTRHRH